MIRFPLAADLGDDVSRSREVGMGPGRVDVVDSRGCFTGFRYVSFLVEVAKRRLPNIWHLLGSGDLSEKKMFVFFWGGGGGGGGFVLASGVFVLHNF